MTDPNAGAKTDASTFVVVPTYNEVDNLEPLLDRLWAVDGVAAVIVVDDASPDGTGELAERLAADAADRQGRCLHVVHRAGKLGLGTAYGAGFEEALARGAGRVITMDADLSHDPAVIPSLIAATTDADLAIGSRYVPGGGVETDWGAHRRALSFGANLAAHAIVGLTARDCTSGYRCYRANLLRDVEYERLRSSGYSYLVEMLSRCQQAGASIREVPIRFTNRRHGQSKISRAEIWRAMRTVVRLGGRRLVEGLPGRRGPGPS